MQMYISYIGPATRGARATEQDARRLALPLRDRRGALCRAGLLAPMRPQRRRRLAAQARRPQLRLHPFLTHARRNLLLQHGIKGRREAAALRGRAIRI